MKIITRDLCPFCERVEIALELRRISLKQVALEERKGGHFPEELVNINPNKTFPTLQITSHLGFAESMIIVEYLDSIDAQGPRLYGDSSEAAAKTKFNLELLSNKVGNFIQKSIYTFNSVVEERKAIANMPLAFENLKNLLIARNSRFLGGDEMNVEDLSLAPFIMRYLAVHSMNNQFPLPTNSRAEKYFHDICHHSTVRKCVPDVEELAEAIKNYSAQKGWNVDRVKNSSRNLLANAAENLKVLNSRCQKVEWQLSSDKKGDFITATFKLNSPEEALRVVGLLNELQESTNHHSSFTLNNFTSLKVDLCTHQPKYGVSEMDMAFAEVFTSKILGN